MTVLFDDAANPGKVTVGLMMAMNAAKKGHATTVVLMVDAAKLAVPGALDGVAVGGPFRPAKDLLDAVLELGGRVVACASCLELFGIAKTAIDPRFGVVTAPDVVDLLMKAGGTFQVT